MSTKHILRKRLCQAAILFLVICFALPEGVAAAQNAAQNKDAKKRSRKDYSYALLFGTVFDQDGRLVRGADIEVREKEGKHKWHAVTDIQGEFAVHLPPGTAVYIVEVSGEGMSKDSKEVSVNSDERQDVALHVTRQK